MNGLRPLILRSVPDGRAGAWLAAAGMRTADLAMVAVERSVSVRAPTRPTPPASPPPPPPPPGPAGRPCPAGAPGPAGAPRPLAPAAAVAIFAVRTSCDR